MSRQRVVIIDLTDEEHAALTVLVRWVDSPTTAACWRRRAMPRYGAAMGPRRRALRD